MDTRQLTFGEHLEELRAHVIRAVTYICVALCGCLFFQEELLTVVVRPQQRVAAEGRPDRMIEAAVALEGALALVRDPGFATATAAQRLEAGARLDRAFVILRSGPEGRLSFLSPQEAFFAYVKVAFICALFIASPLVFLELWRFAAAGLHDAERRYVTVFAPLSYACFVAGALFGYFILIPVSLEYLESYGSTELLTASITLDAYLDLFLGLTLAVGLMFEVPVIAAFLSLLGIVDAAMLREYRRYWLLAAVVIAAVVTPTSDPFTLAICTAPLLALYEVGIIAVQTLERPSP